MRILVPLALIWSSAALAQPVPPTPPVAPTRPGAFVPVGNGATQAYNDALTRMNGAIGAPYSGNADRDFIAKMLPVQQGEIDLAEAELKYGSDAKIKQLAAHIIATEQHNITVLEAWLDKHPAHGGAGLPRGAH